MARSDVLKATTTCSSLSTCAPVRVQGSGFMVQGSEFRVSERGVEGHHLLQFVV